MLVMVEDPGLNTVPGSKAYYQPARRSQVSDTTGFATALKSSPDPDGHSGYEMRDLEPLETALCCC